MNTRFNQRVYDILSEKSALPRIVTYRGQDSPYDDETNVIGPGYKSNDPDDVRSITRRRKEFADRLRKIRRGEATPKQELHTDTEFKKALNAPPKDPDDRNAPDEVPDREGPGSQGGDRLSNFRGPYGRTHAQAAGDIKTDVMNSRGREAEEWVRDAEKAVRDGEERAVRSRNRANQRKKRS